jgi:hypothetical protein
MSGIDPRGFSGNGLEYYFRNDSGQWTVERVPSDTLEYTFATSIAIGPNGEPHISYYDDDQNLMLASRDASGWTVSPIDTDGDAGYFSELVIDASGRFHVTYMEKASDSTGTVKYATRATGEEAWTISTVGELAKLTFGFSGARHSTAIALTQLTGEDFGPGLAAWNDWVEWYERNAADYPPPPGYVDWKANLLGQIDPAFIVFLMPWAFVGRINPTEIVWGGVKKDGIPDLQNPPLMTPEEAEAAYILPDDRLFGVSIIGEHRAYPLRVINAHEMANDVLGGRANRPRLLNALRHRNRVFRQDQRGAGQLWHVGPAVPKQQANVRQGDQNPVAPIHRRAGRRAAGR